MPLEALRFNRPLRDALLLGPETTRERAAAEEERRRQLEAECAQAAVVSAAREQGYRQGRAEADAAFAEQLMAQRQEVSELIEGVLARMSEQQAALATQARASVPGLVMSIVRRILAGCPPDGERLGRIVEQALAEAPDGKDRRLEVSLCPGDLAALERVAGETFRQRHPEIIWQADPDLKTHDCLVRGTFGLIDARLETKLEAIERLFATS